MIIQPALPWWLLLLAFLPPLIGAVILLIRHWRRPRQRWSWLRRAALVLVLLVMILRPATPGGSRATGNALLDVYFMIDTTPSVIAEDYNGNQPRIEGIRHDVKQIAKELTGARFSIIGFDNQVVQHLPLTHDTTTLAGAIDTLSAQEPLYAAGSSIDAGLDRLTKELRRIADRSPNRGRVVFYMGDGEQTTDESPKSFHALKPLIKGGAVLGYGTTSGGKMADEVRRRWDNNKQAYLKDRSGKALSPPDAVSKLDEDNLRTIANQAGLRYIHRTKPDDTKEITATIDIGEIIKSSDETSTYEDWYWIIAPVAIVLLSAELWQLWNTARALKTARKGGSA
ncbi:MAG: vWA domain-containing protein [Candidatus Saccharibacteria bacterium]|nr:vWA domain-containing protein [Candidatus Saccharibacteria bacterium]